MERVLKNNLKPATHYTIALRDKNGIVWSNYPYEMNFLNTNLSTIKEYGQYGIKAIAIFKIRAK